MSEPTGVQLSLRRSSPTKLSVNLEGPDKPGFLEKVISFFTKNELNIIDAKIQSKNGQFRDSFIVERRTTEPMTDAFIFDLETKSRELTGLPPPQQPTRSVTDRPESGPLTLTVPSRGPPNYPSGTLSDGELSPYCPSMLPGGIGDANDTFLDMSAPGAVEGREGGGWGEDAGGGLGAGMGGGWNGRSLPPRSSSDPHLSLGGDAMLAAFSGEEFNPSPEGPPRILVVSRRHLRKGKFVDFVGEFHIDLINHFGGAAVIVPRTSGTVSCLDTYMPMDGFLVVEGNDISPDYNPYERQTSISSHAAADDSTAPTPTAAEGGGGGGGGGDHHKHTQPQHIPHVDNQLVEEIRKKHASDMDYDPYKDKLEWELLRRAVQLGVPYLGICRGCQLLNVQLGGKLFFDVVSEVPNAVPHIDYDNYDGYRHPIRVLSNTPLAEWYSDTIQDSQQPVLRVNSYHHQGIRKLAPNFRPMAHSDDLLVEAFYDPQRYCPEEGRFLVGLQFHPERMLDEYPGNSRVYEAFMLACKNFRRRRLQRAKTMMAS